MVQSDCLVVQTALDWSPGRISGWAEGCTKACPPEEERDRPSQMKHAELKDRRFLFRVSICLPVSPQTGTVAATSRPASLAAWLRTPTKICNHRCIALTDRCLVSCRVPR